MTQKLDSFDLKLLNIIQDNGRMPIVEIAEKIGLSKTPCLNRLRRLERDGYIKSYRAVLDPEKISQGYLVYVQVKLGSTRKIDLESFNAAVKKIPQIMTCHMMAAGYDYLLKVRTRDISEYRHFLTDTIDTLPGVVQTSTFPVMEQVKESTVMTIGSDL
jgi:Lrp/AsnC family leucine-responsive transcriptional regulator